MASFLCMAKDNTHVDPVVDRRGCYKKGYPIVIKPDGYTPSRSEVPPNMVLINVPEVTVEQALAYNNSWEQTVDYNVLSADPVTATYQVEVFGNNTNASGEAAITKDQVETFLTNWNCTVDSFGVNSVTFTMALWQALQSQGFWEVDVTGFTFNLDSYVSGTGVAQVTVSGLTAQQIEAAKRLITQRSCTFLSETADSVIFEAERSDIFTKFKADVSEKSRGTWCRKQFYFSSSVIDQALAMQDTFDGETQLTKKGQITLTQAEALAAINNKLEE